MQVEKITHTHTHTHTQGAVPDLLALLPPGPQACSLFFFFFAVINVGFCERNKKSAKELKKEPIVNIRLKKSLPSSCF